MKRFLKPPVTLLLVGILLAGAASGWLQGLSALFEVRTAHAAVGFVGQTQFGGASQSAMVLNVPTSSADDLLLATMVYEKGSDVIVTPPAGWNLISINAPDANIGMATYWRINNGSEPASYSWGYDQSVKTGGSMSAYSGVNTSSPIDITADSPGGASGDPVAPDVLTTQADTMVIALYGIKKNTTIATPPSGMTLIYTEGQAGATGTAFYVAQAGIAQTGAMTVAPSQQAEWVATTVVLAPSVSTGSCTDLSSPPCVEAYGETASFAESFLVVIGVPRSDSSSIGDALGMAVTIARSDAASFADTMVAALSFGRSDTASFGESAALGVGFDDATTKSTGSTCIGRHFVRCSKRSRSLFRCPTSCSSTGSAFQASSSRNDM